MTHDYIAPNFSVLRITKSLKDLEDKIGNNFLMLNNMSIFW